MLSVTRTTSENYCLFGAPTVRATANPALRRSTPSLWQSMLQGCRHRARSLGWGSPLATPSPAPSGAVHSTAPAPAPTQHCSLFSGEGQSNAQGRITPRVGQGAGEKSDHRR